MGIFFFALFLAKLFYKKFSLLLAIVLVGLTLAFEGIVYLAPGNKLRVQQLPQPKVTVGVKNMLSSSKNFILLTSEEAIIIELAVYVLTMFLVYSYLASNYSRRDVNALGLTSIFVLLVAVASYFILLFLPAYSLSSIVPARTYTFLILQIWFVGLIASIYLAFILKMNAEYYFLESQSFFSAC